MPKQGKTKSSLPPYLKMQKGKIYVVRSKLPEKLSPRQKFALFLYDCARAELRKEKLKNAQRKYRTTEKGKAAHRKYRKSAKGRSAEKNYEYSDKGRKTRREYNRREFVKKSRKLYYESEQGKRVTSKAKATFQTKHPFYSKEQEQRKKSDYASTLAPPATPEAKLIVSSLFKKIQSRAKKILEPTEYFAFKTLFDFDIKVPTSKLVSELNMREEEADDLIETTFKKLREDPVLSALKSQY